MSVLGREPRGLNEPYGIAFYPAGPDPKWNYVGDTDSVMRVAYRTGDLEATGVPARVVDLPHGSGHWTGDVVFSADGKTLFVAVGSESNVHHFESELTSVSAIAWSRSAS